MFFVRFYHLLGGGEMVRMGDTSVYLKLGVIKPPQTRGFSSLKGSTAGASSSTSEHDTSHQRSKLEKRIRRRFGTRIVGVDQEGCPSSSHEVQREDELSVLSSEGSLPFVSHSDCGRKIRSDDQSSTCRSTFSEPIRDDSSEIGSELSYRTTFTEGFAARKTLGIQRQGKDDKEIRDIERRFEALVRKQGHWTSTGQAESPATLREDLSDILREEMGLSASSSSTSQIGNKDINCGICLKSFASMQSMVRHAKRKHPNDLDQATARNNLAPTLPFQCDVCTKVFSSATIFAGHRRRHNEADRKYRCPICPNKGYVMRSELTKHMKSSHGMGATESRWEEPNNQDVPRTTNISSSNAQPPPPQTNDAGEASLIDAEDMPNDL